MKVLLPDGRVAVNVTGRGSMTQRGRWEITADRAQCLRCPHAIEGQCSIDDLDEHDAGHGMKLPPRGRGSATFKGVEASSVQMTVTSSADRLVDE